MRPTGDYNRMGMGVCSPCVSLLQGIGVLFSPALESVGQTSSCNQLIHLANHEEALQTGIFRHDEVCAKRRTDKELNSCRRNPQAWVFWQVQTAIAILSQDRANPLDLRGTHHYEVPYGPILLQSEDLEGKLVAPQRVNGNSL